MGRTASIMILVLVLAAPAMAKDKFIAAPAPAGASGAVTSEYFRVEADKIVDGDTFTFRHAHLDVDISGTCRMTGYNAPEVRGKEKPLGLEASTRLAKLLTRSQVKITAEKRDRYGRWLCDVWLEDGTHVNTDMRAWLENKGFKGVGKYDYLEDK